MNINYLTEAQRKRLKDQVSTEKQGAVITAVVLDVMIAFALLLLFAQGINIVYMSSKLLVGFIVMIGVVVSFWSIYMYFLYNGEEFTFESGIIIKKWHSTGNRSGYYGKIQLENGSVVERIRIGYDNYCSDETKVIVVINKNNKPFCVL